MELSEVKSAIEVMAEPGKLAERIDPAATIIRCQQKGKPEIVVTLRPLSYMQRVYVETIQNRGRVLDRSSAEQKNWRVDYDPESIAQYVQWTIRLGVESVAGVPWNPVPKLVAGRSVRVVEPDGLDVLPDALQDAIFGQVLALTDLGDEEKVKLDFTSPLPEGNSPAATA